MRVLEGCGLFTRSPARASSGLHVDSSSATETGNCAASACISIPTAKRQGGTEVTLRERMLAPINGRLPDCVPCAPWMAIEFPAKILGIPLGDLCGALATVPIWKATLAASRRFGVVSDILSPLCIGGGEYIPLRDAPQNSHTRVRREVYKQTPEKSWVRVTVATPEGDCVEERICPVDGVDAAISHQLKDPAAEYNKIKYLLTDPKQFDWSEHASVQKEVGESGIVRLGFDTPFTRWILLRGPAGYTDIYDYPEIMSRFCDAYTEYVMDYIQAAEQVAPDLYWVHGVYDGMVGAQTLERYVYPFIREIRKHTKRPLVRFISGRVTRLLELEAATGIDVLEVLEPPPTGDVDLSAAKSLIGSKVCLKGNLDPINVLERGTIEEIKDQVQWCLEAAAKNGRYIFSTADEVTPLTTEDKITALVARVEELGKY
jgi:hypothetical protein